MGWLEPECFYGKQRKASLFVFADFSWKKHISTKRINLDKWLSLCQYSTHCFNYSSILVLGREGSALTVRPLLRKLDDGTGRGHPSSQPDTLCQSGAERQEDFSHILLF
jgi:hypothetical protein